MAPRDKKEPDAKAPTEMTVDPVTLLDRRIILLTGALRDESATLIMAQLLYLNQQDRSAPILLQVNSPGGSFVTGMAIMETMSQIAPPVRTYCTGQAGGMALAIVAHGAKGDRKASPEAQFTLIPPVVISPTKEQEAPLVKARHDLIHSLVRDTNQAAIDVARDMEWGRSFTATEARDYGIVDVVEGESLPDSG
jgi:ATP-dependent Clp protease protease subunit